MPYLRRYGADLDCTGQICKFIRSTVIAKFKKNHFCLRGLTYHPITGPIESRIVLHLEAYCPEPILTWLYSHMICMCLKDLQLDGEILPRHESMRPVTFAGFNHITVYYGVLQQRWAKLQGSIHPPQGGPLGPLGPWICLFPRLVIQCCLS